MLIVLITGGLSEYFFGDSWEIKKDENGKQTQPIRFSKEETIPMAIFFCSILFFTIMFINKELESRFFIPEPENTVRIEYLEGSQSEDSAAF